MGSPARRASRSPSHARPPLPPPQLQPPSLAAAPATSPTAPGTPQLCRDPLFPQATAAPAAAMAAACVPPCPTGRRRCRVSWPFRAEQLMGDWWGRGRQWRGWQGRAHRCRSPSLLPQRAQCLPLPHPPPRPPGWTSCRRCWRSSRQSRCAFSACTIPTVFTQCTVAVVVVELACLLVCASVHVRGGERKRGLELEVLIVTVCIHYLVMSMSSPGAASAFAWACHPWLCAATRHPRALPPRPACSLSALGLSNLVFA